MFTEQSEALIPSKACLNPILPISTLMTHKYSLRFISIVWTRLTHLNPETEVYQMLQYPKLVTFREAEDSCIAGQGHSGISKMLKFLFLHQTIK